MISPIPMKIFTSESENNNPNSFPTSPKYHNYKINNYQNINSFFPKKTISKKISDTYLNTQNYQLNNIKSIIPSFQINLSDNSFYNSSLYSYDNKQFSSNQYNNNSRNELHKYHSQEKYNNTNYLSNFSEITHFNGIINSNTNYASNSVEKNKNHKISSFLPKQTINLYEKNNYRNELNLNENRINNVQNKINYLTNNNSNNSIANNLLSGNSSQNYIQNKPSASFKLSDFKILKEIGKGANGTIYVVNYKKNNKNYALKKCEVIYDDDIKKKTEEISLLKDFVNKTGCDGVIRIYGHLCLTNKFGTYYFYELMELAERDWEKEILSRGEKKLYYTEYELMSIFTHLIKTFSDLQSIHFTHRDINPQNIMMVNGKLKICDFGNSRVLRKKGLIIQRVRGSEIFMSPIIFKGYHAGLKTIKHNCFKSDVFSLGMCFLLAASLDYEPLNAIREIYDMNIINKILNKYLGKRHSQKVIHLLLNMLQIEESQRPDFTGLKLLLT